MRETTIEMMCQFDKCLLALLIAGVLLTSQVGIASSLAETQTTAYWQQHGEAALQQALAATPNTNRAKNIILFVGDGNGVASVTATRIFDGQSQGQAGEENILSFERFPYVALSKTYNTNQQTPDSAGTMTAMMTGVKTLAGVLSLGPEVARGDCKNADQYIVPTLLEQVRQRGYATGIVSTARITHATPAATYAHVPERDWEDDGAIPKAMRPCSRDIARQFVENSNIDIAMGGGRRHFLPKEQKDPEYPELKGVRTDDRDLISQWRATNGNGKYIWNNAQLEALPHDFRGPLLALFEPSHMQYETDRSDSGTGEPSLPEMTQRAIALLKNRKEGYFLMVEAGRIDHAHHAGNAYRALVEGQMLSQAVQVATENTDPKDTLIIVTADHSHVLTMAGYPTRGNPILGKVVGNNKKGESSGEATFAEDGKPYTTLSYMNGPGYGYYSSQDARYKGGIRTGRKLNIDDDTTTRHYHQESLVPMYSETHGGEDVAIYARGPWAHLIHGVQEQSYIYYVMRKALGIGLGDE